MFEIVFLSFFALASLVFSISWFALVYRATFLEGINWTALVNR